MIHHANHPYIGYDESSVDNNHVVTHDGIDHVCTILVIVVPVTS